MADTLAVAAEPRAADRRSETIVLPGQAPDGDHILATLVKRSYTIIPGGRCQRAPKDRKLVASDTHFGDPMNTAGLSDADGGGCGFSRGCWRLVAGESGLFASRQLQGQPKMVAGIKTCRNRPERPFP